MKKVFLFATALLAACVTETVYVYQDVTTGETIEFAAVAEARRECGKSIEVPQEETKSEALYVPTPQAAVGVLVKDVTENDRRESDIMATFDKCLLAKGMKKVALN